MSQFLSASKGSRGIDELNVILTQVVLAPPRSPTLPRSKLIDQLILGCWPEQEVRGIVVQLLRERAVKVVRLAVNESNTKPRHVPPPGLAQHLSELGFLSHQPSMVIDPTLIGGRGATVNREPQFLRRGFRPHLLCVPSSRSLRVFPQDLWGRKAS